MKIIQDSRKSYKILEDHYVHIFKKHRFIFVLYSYLEDIEDP